MFGKNVPSPEFRADTQELIEKSGFRYSDRETALLQRALPELDRQSVEEVGKLFRINSKQLSVFEISSLAALFPEKKAAELRKFLLDEKKVMDHVDQVAGAGKLKKQEFWQIFSVLPLSENVQKYIFQKLGESVEGLEPSEKTSEQETDEEISARSAMPVNLPMASLPHFETYLTSDAVKEHLEIPRAAISVIDEQAGEFQTVSLSPQETAVALAYARGRLKYIDENKPELEKKYRKIMGLSRSAEVDQAELKKYYFQRFTERRISELLRQKLAMQGKVYDETATRSELHFTQYKRGISKEVRATIFSPERLKEYFDSRTGTRPSPEGPPSIPSMIPLQAAFDGFTGGDIFALEEMPERNDGRRIALQKFPEKSGFAGKEFLNELQRAHLDINRATKTGEWAEAIGLYVRYLEYWPQYLEHRLGALDVAKKFRTGEIAKFPERILSIASGPHEELRAFFDITQKLGLPMPQVASFDLTAAMLDESRRTLPAGAAEHNRDVVGDMRKLPFTEREFDMIECSSFDNLKDEADIKEMLVQSLGLLRTGGNVRFMVGEPFSEEICRVFEKLGLHILEKNKKPALAEETRERLEAKGEGILKRVEYKLGRHIYFLGRLDREIDPSELRRELAEVSVFSPRRRLTASLAKAGLMEQFENEMDSAARSQAINQTVAMNPLFFLDRKKLDPKYLHYALDQLKGQLDLTGAVRLYRTYFSEARLANYCGTVFELLAEFPQAKRFFSLTLLDHENPKVQALFRDYFRSNAEDFLAPLLESGRSQAEKKELLASIEFSDRVLNTLERHVAEIWNAEAGKARLAELFSCLPDRARLDLPIGLRFSPEYADLYLKFSKDTVGPENYSEREIKRFFARPPQGVEADAQLINSALAMSAGDRSLAQDIFNHIRSWESARIESLVASRRSELAAFLGKLKDKAVPESLLAIRNFEAKYCGAKADPHENIQVLREIITRRYREVFDIYYRPRKSIESTKAEFLQAIEKLFFALQSELGAEPVVLLNLFEQSIEDDSDGTPKQRAMFKLAHGFVSQQSGLVKKLYKKMNPDELIGSVTALSSGRYNSDRAEKFLTGAVKSRPELLQDPNFAFRVGAAISKAKNGDPKSDPYLAVAIKHRADIPAELIPEKEWRLLDFYTKGLENMVPADAAVFLSENEGLFLNWILGKREEAEKIYGALKSAIGIRPEILSQPILLQQFELVVESLRRDGEPRVTRDEVVSAAVIAAAEYGLKAQAGITESDWSLLRFWYLDAELLSKEELAGFAAGNEEFILNLIESAYRDDERYLFVIEAYPQILKHPQFLAGMQQAVEEINEDWSKPLRGVYAEIAMEHPELLAAPEMPANSWRNLMVLYGRAAELSPAGIVGFFRDYPERFFQILDHRDWEDDVEVLLEACPQAMEHPLFASGLRRAMRDPEKVSGRKRDNYISAARRFREQFPDGTPLKEELRAIELGRKFLGEYGVSEEDLEKALAEPGGIPLSVLSDPRFIELNVGKLLKRLSQLPGAIREKVLDAVEFEIVMSSSVVGLPDGLAKLESNNRNAFRIGQVQDQRRRDGTFVGYLARVSVKSPRSASSVDIDIFVPSSLTPSFFSPGKDLSGFRLKLIPSRQDPNRPVGRIYPVGRSGPGFNSSAFRRL